MSTDHYNTPSLYAQLRDQRAAPRGVSNCKTWRKLHTLDCPHFIAEQCTSLKPARRPSPSSELREDKPTEIYGCEQAWRGGQRVRPDSARSKKYHEGSCVACWRELVTDGRTCRVGKLKGTRRPVKRVRRPTANISAVKQRRGVRRVWRVRGVMSGNVEVGGKKTQLF